MINQLKFNKTLWVTCSILALIAGIIGVFDMNIYQKVVSPNLMPAVFTPDLLTIIASVTALVLIYRLKNNDFKKQIIILGILGYFFYGYGIYVIERVYNPLYFIYMAIFSLSFWSIFSAVQNIDKDQIDNIEIPKITRNFSVVLAILQPLVFIPLWISQLIPLVTQGIKIEFLYSIYILDLCFIMPAFLIISFKMIKNKGIGIVLAPIIFILGFIEIFSLALADIIKPYFGTNPETGGWLPALILSLAFLGMAVWHLRELKLKNR